MSLVALAPCWRAAPSDELAGGHTRVSRKARAAPVCGCWLKALRHCPLCNTTIIHSRSHSPTMHAQHKQAPCTVPVRMLALLAADTCGDTAIATRKLHTCHARPTVCSKTWANTCTQRAETRSQVPTCRQTRQHQQHEDMRAAETFVCRHSPKPPHAFASNKPS